MKPKYRGYAAWRWIVRFNRGRVRCEPSEVVVLDLGRKATIRDLYHVDGQAELVDGYLVVHAPTGGLNAGARGSIMFSLHRFEDSAERNGRVCLSRMAFRIQSPHRESICADVSWYAGPLTDDVPPVAPLFAAEVRDFANYGDEAEEFFAIKLADYFAAGTQVVWDVDVLNEELIRVYRASDPENPVVYRRGEIAEAEPAVPGWTFPVDELWD